MSDGIQKLIWLVVGFLCGVFIYHFLGKTNHSNGQTFINILLIAATIAGPALSFQFASWNLKRETKRKFSLEIEYKNKIKIHESLREIHHILEKFDDVNQPFGELEQVLSLFNEIEKLKVAPGVLSVETEKIFETINDLNIFIQENLCSTEKSLRESQISDLNNLNSKIRSQLIELKSHIIVS